MPRMFVMFYSRTDKSVHNVKPKDIYDVVRMDEESDIDGELKCCVYIGKSYNEAVCHEIRECEYGNLISCLDLYETKCN